MATQTPPDQVEAAQPHNVTWTEIFKELAELREEIRVFKETKHAPEGDANDLRRS